MSLVLKFASLLLQLCSVAVLQCIMEKILIKYEGNRLSRYDENEYLECASRLEGRKMSEYP